MLPPLGEVIQARPVATASAMLTSMAPSPGPRAPALHTLLVGFAAGGDAAASTPTVGQTVRQMAPRPSTSGTAPIRAIRPADQPRRRPTFTVTTPPAALRVTTVTS